MRDRPRAGPGRHPRSRRRPGGPAGDAHEPRSRRIPRELEVQRPDRQAGLELDDEPLVVVTEVDLRFAALRKEAVGLDDRLDHDGLEFARRHLDLLLAQHLHHHGVALVLEVAVERVRLADLERQRAHEVEEGDVVERLRRRERAAVAVVDAAPDARVRMEIQDAVPLVVDLLDVLVEAVRLQPLHVEPRLVVVVDPGERDRAVQPEVDDVAGRAAQRIDSGDLE